MGRRRSQTIPFFASLATPMRGSHALGALALCAGAAVALPPKAMDPGAGDDVMPASVAHALRARAADAARNGARPHAGAASGVVSDLSGAFGGVSRGASGGEGALATFDSAFESLTPLPAELVGQNDTGRMWGGSAAGVTGSPRFVAATAPLAAPQYGAVSDPIGGNATQKLRGLVDPAYGPNAFFGRWLRYDLFKTNATNGAGLERFVFRPDTGQDVRMAHDTFVTAINSLWTSEPTYVSSGFIIGRLLWGGENATSGIGLPIGPIPDFYVLTPNCGPIICPPFNPCQTPAFYRSGAPFPGGAGQNVPVPVNSWFKIIHETTADGLLRHVLDLYDGHGEFVIYEGETQVGRVDRLAAAGGYERLGDAMYVDNMRVEGVEFTLPVPPALECAGAGQPCTGSGQYVDDQRWMFVGPLRGQSSRWVDALSSRAQVIENGADKAIERTNLFNDDRYRQEIRTLLPLTFASGVGPFRICIEVDIASSQAFPNSTVQAISPASVSEDQFVSRLFIGRFDPTVGQWPNHYTSRMYVQTNPNYNPIDDENTVAPYSPGPNGNGGAPVVGVDVADTGVNWSFNGRRNVCFEVDQQRTLSLTIDGVQVFAGQAFVNSIDQLHLESENNGPGAGNTITYDDLVLNCSVLPSVALPAFSLVYSDNLEWGIEGITIGLQDDDCNMLTPFRWSSAAMMPIVTLNTDGSSKVLRMENVFRDTPPLPPNAPSFQLFTQASTALPHVEAGPARGWAARSHNLLTDGATSRTWASGHAVNASFVPRGASLAFSSVTGTFWFEVMDPSTPDPGDTIWIDIDRTPASVGAPIGQWFTFSIHRNLNQRHTFRINGRLLRYGSGPNAGAPVIADTLHTPGNGPHKNLDRLIFLGSDESSAPVGSILYTDNIRAWSLPCLGDTNNDGVVNFADLNDVLGFFGQSAAPNTDITGNIAPDADNDGVPDDDIVNFADLNVVLSGFGIPCSAQQ